MTQQSLAAESRVPHWIADMVVGGTAALLAITVAQAAIPEDGQRLAKLSMPRPVPAAKPTAQAQLLNPAEIVFDEPAPGYSVISPFGLRKLPWEEHGRLHQGVDIAAPFGVPVQVIADGVVVSAGQDGAYGRFVEVQHANGFNSFYAHLGGFTEAARAGTAVKRGAAIGKIGSTGSSTGAHLHFEIRRDGRPLNPTYFMGKRYANAEELPFRQAGYVPRRVRVAYVSYIPKSRREQMEEREEAKQIAEAEKRLAALTRLPTTRLESLERLPAMPASTARTEIVTVDMPTTRTDAPKPAPARAVTETPV
ncbi:MAG TPA: M23 family metallopeptidase, partial [Phenylobacterium sp.]